MVEQLQKLPPPTPFQCWKWGDVSNKYLQLSEVRKLSGFEFSPVLFFFFHSISNNFCHFWCVQTSPTRWMSAWKMCTVIPIIYTIIASRPAGFPPLTSSVTIRNNCKHFRRVQTTPTTALHEDQFSSSVTQRCSSFQFSQFLTQSSHVDGCYRGLFPIGQQLMEWSEWQSMARKSSSDVTQFILPYPLSSSTNTKKMSGCYRSPFPYMTAIICNHTYTECMERQRQAAVTFSVSTKSSWAQLTSYSEEKKPPSAACTALKVGE